MTSRESVRVLATMDMACPKLPTALRSHSTEIAGSRLIADDLSFHRDPACGTMKCEIGNFKIVSRNQWRNLTLNDAVASLPSMTAFYPPRLPIRDDLAAAQTRAWARIAQPGTWWDGAARVAIAAETRQAPLCRLCHRRKELASPLAIAGTHNSLGQLPEAAVEVVHRVRTDPGRLGEGWYRGIIGHGLTEEEYVEIVSIVAHVVAIDTMARGLDLEPLPLPNPQPGLPARRRPAGAKPGGAWVPWLEPIDASGDEAGIYPTTRPPANIMKAMSLVPDEVRSFFDLVTQQYLPGEVMRDFAHEYRAITHAQIELLAARVSALNRCLY